MAQDEDSSVRPGNDLVDAALKDQLAAIKREETPERLLVLARELQRLLRSNHR